METTSWSHTPPVVLFLKTMSGFCLFRRMPTASSSISSNRRCSSDFVASSMMRIRSAVFAASDIKTGRVEKKMNILATT